LLPVFAGWPSKTFVRSVAVLEPDLKAAEKALDERGDRTPYCEFRKELGL